jgi:tetratricopeptide (TPR) repeat protein
MNESIEELRQRWERDPSPQLALHLAEEYRRHDQRHEAVEVLSRALQAHPGHMAAKVALGRYEFEMGNLAAARQHLEQVAQQDPTHLVASKLLVSLYLEAGEDKQARDRLDLYKLLNESDPDIESLEAQLEGGDRARPRVPVTTAAVVVDVPRNGDPFKDLWADADSEQYWQAIAAEGIFPVARTLRMAVPSPGPAPIPEDYPVPGTTVTLAQLYLQQGHLDDAEEAFREVLSREPGNIEAAAGLEEVNSQRAEGIAGEPEPGRQPGADDSTARKIEALNDYLQRIRAADKQR